MALATDYGENASGRRVASSHELGAMGTRHLGVVLASTGKPLVRRPVRLERTDARDGVDQVGQASPVKANLRTRRPRLSAGNRL